MELGKKNISTPKIKEKTLDKNLFVQKNIKFLREFRRNELKQSKAPRASARGVFKASAKPAEAYPSTLKPYRIPFPHSSPSFRTGHSVRACKAKISEYNRSEKRLQKLSQCFLSFGTDPDENINYLVALCGEDLSATCALYNCLQDGMLHSIGQWNTPPDFTSIDKPDGHICYDLIQSAQNEVHLIRNLQKTIYAQTDPNVMHYGLKTYVGKTVAFGGAMVGSLCIVYQEDFMPSEDDKKFLGIIASAIGVEEERKRAEEKYRTIVSTTMDGFWIVDMQGRFLDVNDAYCRLIGYSRDELLTMSILDVEAVERPEETARRIQMIMEVGGDRFETHHKCKDGRIIDIEVSVNYIEIGGGRMFVFLRDITERKQIEEALREGERFLASIFTSIQDCLTILDNDFNIVRTNPTIEKLFSHAMPLVEKKCYEVYHGRKERCEACPAYRTITTGESAYEVFPIRGADGEIVVWLNLSSFPLIDLVSGKTKGVIEYVRDITKYKQAEEAQRKSENRFKELYDNAPVGYHEFDTEGRITRVNRTELEMLGYTKEEMFGRYIWDFIVEEVSPKSVKAKLTGQLPPDPAFERTFRRKDGTIFPALIQERLLRDDKGRIIGIRSTIQDISERKRIEDQMNNLQEQLRQSQKMEAIGRLAGGIAHDFNNLLTIIKGYSQLSLHDLKESDPLRENLQEIQSATQQATNLTRQLLAFSRRQILEPKVLDLNALLKDLDKMLLRIIGEDIELATLLADDLWRVKIDPGQFEQIILNLVVNAKDAMPSGGKLTIETANVELDEEYAHAHIGVIPGRYVRLSVTDTGAGMPQAIKEKIFEPFFTTKQLGTGLGLSTVYGIVNQSGGTIWVYSEPGHGTTLKIYLLRVEEELDILQRQEETDPSPRGNETVLLVEDDQSVRSLAYRILHQQGYTILEAANGEEALRLAQEHAGEKIDLLFTDVVMPHVSGKELADQLKLLRPDIKVLYTSGYTDNAIVHHGVLEPGTHILQKPYSPKSLLQKVREVLDK